uniref:Uncharacterized protein n=1 Tax=Serinus canaria TaxID=9135 RepID=A0A8C9MP22_SERCA
MSFSQFGYPYSTTSQVSPSTTCCEAAPRSGPDASSAPAAASLCCAPYESRLLAPGRAELNANPQYEIKDGAGTLHSGIAQPATYYSYDHSLGQYQYDRPGCTSTAKTPTPPKERKSCWLSSLK